ncbi:MAG TPA: hypothetical protein VJ208_04175 [Candidatus Nanoarchaeia archaeon]|nr:hypothetical protein [Candidatus Nanoarchaeia archaeon]
MIDYKERTRAEKDGEIERISHFCEVTANISSQNSAGFEEESMEESVEHRINRFVATQFYISNRGAINSGKEPECSQYQGLVDKLNQH